MKIIFVGGGTGGHIAPALSIAELVGGAGGECSFLASFRAVPSFAQHLEGLNWTRIPSAPVELRRPWRWPGALFRNLAAYRVSSRIMKAAPPDLVIGMGGYPSLLPVLAARRLNIPIVLYEANSVPGRANRWLFGRGAVMLRALPPAPGYPLQPGQARVRPALPPASLDPAPKGTLESWGLGSDRTTILVMGGSHGARTINRRIIAALPELSAGGLKTQFIHIGGEGMTAGLEEEYRRWNFPARIFSFTDRIGWLYSLADLVISRGGAASVAEIIHWGIPSILIPYPWATDDHQMANARCLEKLGAAMICPDNEKGTVDFSGQLISLVKDGSRLQSMRESARLGLDREVQEILPLLEQVASGSVAPGG